MHFWQNSGLLAQKSVFGTALMGMIFFHLTLLWYQNIKTSLCTLFKNVWVMPFFITFRSARKKLHVTVFFDHPVLNLLRAFSSEPLDCQCSRKTNIREGLLLYCLFNENIEHWTPHNVTQQFHVINGHATQPDGAFSSEPLIVNVQGNPISERVYYCIAFSMKILNIERPLGVVLNAFEPPKVDLLLVRLRLAEAPGHLFETLQ